jgi:hypothetical protein
MKVCERLLLGYEASWQLLCATPAIALSFDARGQRPLWSRVEDLEGPVLPIKLFDVGAWVP